MIENRFRSIKDRLASMRDEDVNTALQQLEEGNHSLDDGYLYGELIRIAKETCLSDGTRMRAIEIATEMDPSDNILHDDLVEIICLYDDVIALKAAEMIGECLNISDIDLVEEIQHCILKHNSLRVRRQLRMSVEELIEGGGLSEEIEHIYQDRLLDTSRFEGVPEDLSDIQSTRERVREEEKEYDLFISFASEQRESIVKPLVTNLEAQGISVWYDEKEVTLAAKIREKILDGINRSLCLLVIISKEYINKKWTRLEFDEINSVRRTCNYPFIPLIYDVTMDQLAAFGDGLLDIKCTPVTEENVVKVSCDIAAFIQKLSNLEH